MTTSAMPSATSFSRCHSTRRLPPTRSRGLGVVSVSGRMRSPRPAAKISAFMRGTSFAHDRIEPRHGGLHGVFDEALQAAEFRMARQHVVEVAEEARDVGEVFRLGIAMVEPREDADDLEVALHANQV